MASKYVLTRYKPLLKIPNHLTLTFGLLRMVKYSSLPPTKTLVSNTTHPFMIQKSLEMTQATTLSPTDVHPRGPCPPPVLKCPPPPCACPPPPETVTVGNRLLRILWFLTKLGVFLAVVKFTIDEGLWGDSEETEELAKRMGILSEAKEEPPKKDQKEAEGKEPSPSIPEYWNKLVVKGGDIFGLHP